MISAKQQNNYNPYLFYFLCFVCIISTKRMPLCICYRAQVYVILFVKPWFSLNCFVRKRKNNSLKVSIKYTELDALRIYFVEQSGILLLPNEKFIFFPVCCLFVDELSAKDNNSKIPLNALGFCNMSFTYWVCDSFFSFGSDCRKREREKKYDEDINEWTFFFMSTAFKQNMRFSLKKKISAYFTNLSSLCTIPKYKKSSSFYFAWLLCVYCDFFFVHLKIA